MSRSDVSCLLVVSLVTDVCACVCTGWTNEVGQRLLNYSYLLKYLHINMFACDVSWSAPDQLPVYMLKLNENLSLQT